MEKILFWVFLVIGLNAHSQEYLPGWQAGCLDIHNIATGRGDATFIVLPDATTMVIDCGEMDNCWGVPQVPDDSRTAAEWVAAYIEHFSKGLPHPGKIDYLWITHLHADHVGLRSMLKPGDKGYDVCGVMRLGDFYKFGNIIDRGYPDYDFPSREKIVRELGTFPEYQAFIEYQKAHNGSKPQSFITGSNKQFSLLNDPKAYKGRFEVRNLACSGEIWTGRGLKTRKLYSGDTMLFDENVLSGVIRMRYGNFTYYNGGDLGGGNHHYKCRERDMETAVGELCGPVTVAKLDHHGWKDSSNARWLNSVRPQCILIPSCAKDHPYENTLRRILDPLVYGDCEVRDKVGPHAGVFVTTDASRKMLGDELFSKMKPYGHVVVRVYDGGTSYQVFVLDNKSTDYHIIYKTEIIDLP